MTSFTYTFCCPFTLFHLLPTVYAEDRVGVGENTCELKNVEAKFIMHCQNHIAGK